MKYYNQNTSQIKPSNSNTKLLRVLWHSSGYLTRHLEILTQESFNVEITQTALKKIKGKYFKSFYFLDVLNTYLIQRKIILQTHKGKKFISAISWWPIENFKYYVTNPKLSIGYNLSKRCRNLKKRRHLEDEDSSIIRHYNFEECNKGYKRMYTLWEQSKAICLIEESFLGLRYDQSQLIIQAIESFMNFLRSIFITTDRHKIQVYESMVSKINLLEVEIKNLSDQDLSQKTYEFRERIGKGESLDSLLVEAFAVVKEVFQRTLQIKLFDVQLLGGIVLHRGNIAEMKTGEGKTLVAALPAYLNALSGKGVHIVTVNDYLARRDAEYIGRVFQFLDLTVGLIQQNMFLQNRKENYNCDITYITNSELGFDYLKDNMATSIEEVVQRSFNYCIIDEVDSILIDEARTPLIVSGPAAVSPEKYISAAKLSSFLRQSEHYDIDEKTKNVILTEKGITVCEQAFNVADIYDLKNPWAHYIYNALKAKEFFLLNVHYIIQQQEIVIVDEFTGRIMPGRRWSDGLHQAIEAKESVKIEQETQTLASITYQNLFLLYPKLSGMTGTAKTEEGEFDKIYQLEVLSIPTNREMIRNDFPDLIYKTDYEKWKAVANECIDMYKLGKPVLVGTTSVEKSELLAELLIQYKIPYNILNARPENVQKEAGIVAQAGQKNTITIATNMAGRGTDIILGGNLNYKIKEQLNKLISCYFQNNIGELNEILCGLPYELHSRVKDNLRNLEGLGNYSQEEISEKLTIASEGIDTLDKYTLILQELYMLFTKRYKDLFQRAHKEVTQLGGLYVIGTERHDSRRIDNQLRGRSGRQGDPGSSRFFLSLEDNLLRIFGGARISSLMSTLQVDGDTPIESPMISKSLESAQKKVEGIYYDSRKQLFEYDEVLNIQRQAIYSERKRILNTVNLRDVVLDCARISIDELIDTDSSNLVLEGNIKSIKAIQYLIGVPNYSLIKHSKDIDLEKLRSLLYKQLIVSYDLKEAQFNQKKIGSMRALERLYLLQQIDTNWIDHLQQMSFLRESVGWRGYGQKDPLTEYKNEAYNLFGSMLTAIRQNVVYCVFKSNPST
nr:preprotein translocase subunit SecA [Cavernulicola chilensis]